MRTARHCLALIVVLGACGRSSAPAPMPQAHATAPDSCARVNGKLPPDATADHAAGEYSLVLVATTGSAAGKKAEGRLSLGRVEGDLRYSQLPELPRDTSVRYPLAGTTTVDVAAVGAVNTGDMTSRDPMRPGVLVIERAGSITIRLGADANRRDVQRFDGGYTALRVQQLEKERIAGTWESGTARMHAGGYFCATRTGSS